MPVKLRLCLLALLLSLPIGLHAQDDAGCLPSRLVIGARGRVLPGEPNNVRITPSTESTILNQIPAGGVFTVLEGPECAAAIAWWRVEYDGVEGWTAEASGEEYYLEPAILITPENAAQLTLSARFGQGQMTTRVVWSSDGATIAVGGHFGIWLYNAHDLDAAPRLLEDDTDEIIRDILFSPDGSTLVSVTCAARGCEQEKLWFWEVSSGILFRTVEHSPTINRLTFNSDGSLLAGATANHDILVWDATTETEQRFTPGHNDTVTSVAFSPVSWLLASGGIDRTLFLTGSDGTSLSCDAGEPANPFDGISALAFNEDGTFLASAVSWEIRIWDVSEPGQCVPVATLPNRGGVHREYHEGSTQQYDPTHSCTLAFTRHLLASGNDSGSITFWAVEKSSGQVSFSELPMIEAHVADPVGNVAFSPDGDQLVSNSHQPDNQIKVWDISDPGNTALLSALYEGHTGYVQSIAFSPDGRTLLSGDEGAFQSRQNQDTLLLWDIATGRLVRAFYEEGRVYGVAFSPDGTLVAATGEEYGGEAAWPVIILWDMNTGQQRAYIMGSLFSAWNMAFSPDGATIATGGTAQAYADTDLSLLSLWDVERALQQTRLEYDFADYERDSYQGTISALTYSSDGNLLAVGTYDGNLSLLNAAGNQQIMELDSSQDAVRDIAFSFDGQLIAAATGSANYDESSQRILGDDLSVHLWNVTSGIEVHVLPHAEIVTSVVFSPDARLIVAGTADGIITIWDALSGERLTSLTAHRGAVYDLAFSPDGTLLASGGDWTIRLWHIPSP